MPELRLPTPRVSLLGQLFPVLLYHEVAPLPGTALDAFSTTPSVMADHIAILCDRGYELVTLSELAGEIGRSEPRRVASITFDDGLRSFVDHALPALADARVPATMYVPTAWLGRVAGWMDSDEPVMSVADLHDIERAGVEVGSHSHHHPQLDLVDSTRLVDELRRSKELLEDALGHSLSSVAYPHGFHDRAVRDAAVAAGYHNAAAVKNAWAHGATDRFAIARMTVGPDQDATWLDDHLERGWPLDPGRELIRTRVFRQVRRRRGAGRRQAVRP